MLWSGSITFFRNVWFFLGQHCYRVPQDSGCPFKCCEIGDVIEGVDEECVLAELLAGGQGYQQKPLVRGPPPGVVPPDPPGSSPRRPRWRSSSVSPLFTFYHESAYFSIGLVDIPARRLVLVALAKRQLPVVAGSVKKFYKRKSLLVQWKRSQ